MDNEELARLLNEERILSDFRKERWENAEARIEAIWNKAINACREKLGQHTPVCNPNEAMPCHLCWQNAKLASLLQLDGAGYKTVRERIEAKRWELTKAICLRDAEGWNFELEGANKMAAAISQIFGEKE